MNNNTSFPLFNNKYNKYFIHIIILIGLFTIAIILFLFILNMIFNSICLLLQYVFIQILINDI